MGILLNTITPGSETITGKACYPPEVTLTGAIASSGTRIVGTGTEFTTELFYGAVDRPTVTYPTVDQGNWDASTNAPALASEVGTEGDLYTVTVAGNTNLDSNAAWAIGDIAVFHDLKWRRVAAGNPSGTLKYKYLYSETNCEILEIDYVVSNTVLYLKVAPSAPLAAETLKVPQSYPPYKMISLSCLGAGNLLGTPNSAPVTLDADSVVTYDNDTGLEPICIDGTASGIQVITQI